MALFNWTLNPWREMARIRNDVLSAFEKAGAYHTGELKANVVQDDEKLLMQFELAGVKAEDLSIETERNVLRLTVERKPEEGIDEGGYHRREREYGKFTRELTLPAGYDAEDVSAELKNGLLTIKMPRAEAARPRKITVS